MMQLIGVAGGVGGLRAGVRLHDRATARLGAVGERDGGARWA